MAKKKYFRAGYGSPSKVELRNIMKRANRLEKEGYSKKGALKESWRIYRMQRSR